MAQDSDAELDTPVACSLVLCQLFSGCERWCSIYLTNSFTILFKIDQMTHCFWMMEMLGIAQLNGDGQIPQSWVYCKILQH